MIPFPPQCTLMYMHNLRSNKCLTLRSGPRQQMHNKLCTYCICPVHLIQRNHALSAVQRLPIEIQTKPTFSARIVYVLRTRLNTAMHFQPCSSIQSRKQRKNPVPPHCVTKIIARESACASSSKSQKQCANGKTSAVPLKEHLPQRSYANIEL